ncbi:hypothetical protein ACIF6L_31530 [Kitasatospora sp. NPDC086009]|uniref:hypothetical protein n=1 Tax=unclassified Kitasatospora TaxID=2633591 RepID=UPI0037C804E4
MRQQVGDGLVEGLGRLGVGAELYARPYWAGTENRHKATMELKQTARPNDAVQGPAA